MHPNVSPSGSPGPVRHHALPSTRSFRFRIWLTSAMWVPVMAANVVAIALGLALPGLDDGLRDQSFLPLNLSSVQQILGALAGGMITFTGIVFSAVLVAAQIQTSSYSPRLAARLRRDRIIILAFALPTATASYSLFALASLGGQAHEDSALTVLVALGLTFATFAGFVALVQRAFDSTQIGGILRGLMRRALRVSADVHPPRPAGQAAVVEAAPAGPVTAEVPYVGPPGVLASVDRSALVALARQTGAWVEVVPTIGQYIPPRSLALRLVGGDRPPPEGSGARILVLARQRSTDQDPGFILRMFVDIAIRALSPAVNDPTTAVQALDRIEHLLVELHGRVTGPSLVLDEDGVPRGRFPAPTWDEYLTLGLIEIRHYGAGSAQVHRRLRALHAHLETIAEPDELPRLELERRLLDEDLAAGFPDPDERALLSRRDALGLGGAP
jgi:uncharacterized membrane protein